MAIIKSFKDIVNSMLRYLHSQRPFADASPGTFTRDVVIDAPASEMESLYLDLNRTSNAQSPDLASTVDIEKLGKNFQLRRRGPLKATGTVSFYSFEPPTTLITIPRGTTVASKALSDGTSQQFMTTQDVTLSNIDFSADTGRYEVTATVRATVAGIDGNIPPGAIAAILDPIAGVAGVYNFNAFTNGANFETLVSFRARVKSVITGNSVGTADGYYQTITRITDVIDARIASSDTGIEELRRADVGAVDIYIRGLISTQAPSESYTVASSAPYEFIVSKQPIDLLSADSFSLIGSITGTLVKDTHYTIARDTSKFAGSIRGFDKFIFTDVTPGETITILYSYNSLIESLQTYMEGDTRKILGADLLIKGAKPRQIDIGCTIRLLSGYVASKIIIDVTTALSIFLDSYTIGEEVQQSDILSIITDTTGVDDVVVPLGTFEENSITGNLEQDSSGNIIIPADSYATAGDITVTVRA